MFWKWWYLVYKMEVGQGLSKDTTIKILDVSGLCLNKADILANYLQVLALVTKEKNLQLPSSWVVTKSNYIY